MLPIDRSDVPVGTLHYIKSEFVLPGPVEVGSTSLLEVLIAFLENSYRKEHLHIPQHTDCKMKIQAKSQSLQCIG